MADNKKSFVVYCDLINTVEKLPNDEAGKLFKHMLNYVNDNNPETDSLIVDIAFEPIKQQLKRDLQKYENRCKANKINGNKGGRPSTKKTENNPRKPNGLNGLNNKPNATQDKANKPDTDNDNDNDNDIKEKDLSFDLFYSKYPVKKSKSTARKKWHGMNQKERISAHDGIDGYIKTVPHGINYCHPSTYLNQKRWEDEITTDEKNKQNDRLTKNQELELANKQAFERARQLESEIADEENRGGIFKTVGDSANALPKSKFCGQNGLFD